MDVAGVADIPADGALRVMVGDTPVCLVALEGTVHALHDTCTHARASLCEGVIDGGVIECPRHGARFDIATGAVRTPPATVAQPTFNLTVRDGRILVDPTPSHPHPFDN